MAYCLPLRFIKISKKNNLTKCDVSICATRIVSMMSLLTYQARQIYKLEKKAGTLINACGRLKGKTIIFLDNGTVAASPLSVNSLMLAIEKSNFIANKYNTPRVTKRLRVYDVADEDEREDDEEDIERNYFCVDNLEEIIKESEDELE